MRRTIEFDDHIIRHWVLEKRANEIELAWDLQDVFNRHESLVGPLRQLASFAIDELDALRRGSIEGQRVVSASWEKERKGPRNQVIIRHGSLANLANAVPTLTASECSDVIRLYGEVVEKGGQTAKAAEKAGGSSPLQPYKQLDTQRMSFRQGGDPVWVAGRQRDRVDAQHPMPPPDNAAKEFVASQHGGISASLLRDGSTVLKIDRVFGLMEAADISGTTTDSIFFVHRYSSLFAQQFQQQLLRGALDDPIYQLLALATLVAGGHHSVLESGLSLSLNQGVTGVDYRVGLYTTLMPAGSRHEARGAVEHVLAYYEGNARNRLMLLSYNAPAHFDECFLFSKQGRDRAEFADLARADLTLLRRFRQLGNPWPTRLQLAAAFPGVEGMLHGPRVEAVPGGVHA